jgi:hypothetical protein
MNKSFFHPRGAAVDRSGRVDIRNIRCACGGVMFDVTTAFVAAAGAAHYECDTCHERCGILCGPTPRPHPHRPACGVRYGLSPWCTCGSDPRGDE